MKLNSPCRKDAIFKVLTVTWEITRTKLKLASGSLDIQTPAQQERSLESALGQQGRFTARIRRIHVETRIRTFRLKKHLVSFLFSKRVNVNVNKITLETKDDVTLDDSL